MNQHQWKDLRGLDEREDELAGTGGEKPRKLGHLTYRQGKPIPGLCYCTHTAAHDADQEDTGTQQSGLLQLYAWLRA